MWRALLQLLDKVEGPGTSHGWTDEERALRSSAIIGTSNRIGVTADITAAIARANQRLSALQGGLDVWNNRATLYPRIWYPNGQLHGPVGPVAPVPPHQPDDDHPDGGASPWPICGVTPTTSPTTWRLETTSGSASVSRACASLRRVVTSSSFP